MHTSISLKTKSTEEMMKFCKCIFIILIMLFPLSVQAQDAGMSSLLKIKTIPYPLKKINDSLKLEIKGDSVLTIKADANINLFNSPQGN